MICNRRAIACILFAIIVNAACLAETITKDASVPDALKRHVFELTNTTKPRSYKNTDSLNAAADYVEGQFRAIGLKVKRQEYKVNNEKFRNIIGSIDTGNKKTIVVGAHYDVFGEGPGADDNASGVAGLIELGRTLKKNKDKLKYNIEFVAYSTEEPPFFRTNNMGSYIHAQSIKDKKDEIEYMICLEMIGYYTEENNSQRYPNSSMKQVYPKTGNFIAVVGNDQSFSTISRIKKAILENSKIECQSLVAPSSMLGMDFSDHLNYWALGINAVMITDTAFFRNKNYHKMTDTPETLDYLKMSEVIKGLAASFYK